MTNGSRAAESCGRAGPAFTRTSFLTCSIPRTPCHGHATKVTFVMDEDLLLESKKYKGQFPKCTTNRRVTRFPQTLSCTERISICQILSSDSCPDVKKAR